MIVSFRSQVEFGTFLIPLFSVLVLKVSVLRVPVFRVLVFKVLVFSVPTPGFRLSRIIEVFKI